MNQIWDQLLYIDTNSSLFRSVPLWRQDTVSYKKQEGFPQIKNSVVGIPAI